MKKNRYICEVCGKVKILTTDEAFEKGWDHPPFIGEFGVVSPRTCPDVLWKKRCGQLSYLNIRLTLNYPISRKKQFREYLMRRNEVLL